jgi:hypothetical protein
MGRQAAVVLYVLAMVTVIVGVDVLFFRNHFWERLLVNVGIVMVFAAVCRQNISDGRLDDLRESSAHLV